MAFGTGPFGYFEAGSAYALPAEAERADLSSSRSINARARYDVNAAGGIEGMDDVAQTVLLIVAYAATRPAFITPQTLGADQTAIATGLKQLTDGRKPVIRLEDVTSRRGAAGKIERVVSYVNLRTNTRQTVTY